MAVDASLRSSRSAVALFGAVVCALTVAACGSSTPNAPSTTAATTATSATATSATSAGSSGGGGSTTTLSGTIEEGVESGCVVLVGSDGAVLANLIDLDTAAAPLGSEVEVTGTFEEDMMTTCQQGKPFSITTLEVG